MESKMYLALCITRSSSLKLLPKHEWIAHKWVTVIAYDYGNKKRHISGAH